MTPTDGTMTSDLPRRELGTTGLKVTPLGLAVMTGPQVARGSAKLTAEDVERAFHEFGVNTFLTSTHMKALCEGVRRLIRSGHREDLVLASGVGLPFGGSVRRGLEQHLGTLGTDHLDLWFLGWVQRRWYVRDAVWSAMRGLRDEGKTRAIGFSSHNRRLAAALVHEVQPDVLMIRYNASHRGAEREVFDVLAPMGRDRPGIIAYTATRWGRLLRPLPEHGFPTAMTGPECYRFVLDHPLVDMVWCAAATSTELHEDVAGVHAGPLPPERRAEVCRFGDAVHDTARRGWRWMFGSSSH